MSSSEPELQKEVASLYYRDGSSDKVYRAQLEPQGSGFVVNFQYGRRGQSLQTGTKTASPLPYDKAKKIFDKLIAEKKAKGYSEGEQGTPFSGTDNAGKVSGLVPQLLNPITEETTMRLLKDDAFFLQEKMDGVRIMIRLQALVVEASNRRGLIVPIPALVEMAVKALFKGHDVVLDGELIGDVYYVFDMLEFDDKDLRQEYASSRITDLEIFLAKLSVRPNVKLVKTAWTTDSKEELFEDIKVSRGEGVVLKRKDSKYVPGRPNSGGNQLKYKFTQTATCQVKLRNEGKRSVTLRLSTGLVEEYVEVGSVTIPANFRVPAPLELVEVRYLYAYPSGSLFQPVYLGPRSDKTMPDLYNTLKFKQGSEDDEA